MKFWSHLQLLSAQVTPTGLLCPTIPTGRRSDTPDPLCTCQPLYTEHSQQHKHILTKNAMKLPTKPVPPPDCRLCNKLYLPKDTHTLTVCRIVLQQNLTV